MGVRFYSPAADEQIVDVAGRRRVAIISTAGVGSCLALDPLIRQHNCLLVQPAGKHGADTVQARRLQAAMRNRLTERDVRPGSGVSLNWLRIPAREINGQPFVDFVRQWTPDLLITSGSPLLKRRLFSLPRWGSYNLHWGISPEYSGADSIRWALFDRNLSSGPRREFPSVVRGGDIMPARRMRS